MRRKFTRAQIIELNTRQQLDNDRAFWRAAHAFWLTQAGTFRRLKDFFNARECLSNAASMRKTFGKFITGDC